MENKELLDALTAILTAPAPVPAQVGGDTLTDSDGWAYCVIRSRDQGVIAGFVDVPAVRALLASGQQAHGLAVRGARQLWSWDSKFVLMELSELGVRCPEECKFSMEKSMEFEIFGQCGLYTCTRKAAESIRAVAGEEP